jgi:hypothetical protein
MTTPRKTPEEVYKISQGFVDDPGYGSRPWLKRCLERYEDRKMRDLAPHTVPVELAGRLGDLQVNLYFLALMQLRWGFDGLRKTMDELDSLLPLFDKAYTDLGTAWSFDSCRLDAYLRLNYLLDRPPIDNKYFRSWASGETMLNGAPADAGDANWICTHKFEVAIETVLRERKAVDPPCDFPTVKRYALNASTYRSYLGLVNDIVLDRWKDAEAKLAEGVKLYRRRVSRDDGDGYLGYGPNNHDLFDFQLTAMIEFARRAKGWEFTVDEPYSSVYTTVLKNAAAFREEGHRTG